MGYHKHHTLFQIGYEPIPDSKSFEDHPLQTPIGHLLVLKLNFDPVARAWPPAIFRSQRSSLQSACIKSKVLSFDC